MIDDKAQDAIMKAYEKTILNEVSNVVKVKDVKSWIKDMKDDLPVVAIVNGKEKPVKGIRVGDTGYNSTGLIFSI